MKQLVKVIVAAIIVQIILNITTYAVEFPEVDSKIVEVYDMTEDKIIYEKNSKNVTLIASLTKIATTITAIENIENMDEEVTITKEVIDTLDPETSMVGLESGDVVTYRDLIYAILVPSGADAAHSIAILSSGSLENFVEKMNDMAEKVELWDTHFTNVTGLEDVKHYSTADDIRKLLVYSLKNPLFRQVYTTKQYTLTNGLEIESTLFRYNIAPKDISKILGSKTGYLENLGYCLSSLSNVDGHEILTINLGAKKDGDDYYNIIDNVKIIDYLNDNYGNQVLVEKGTHIKNIRINLSKNEEYEVKCNTDVKKFLSNDYDKSLVKAEYNGLEELSFRNSKEDKIGTINYYYDDELVTTEDVVLDQNIGLSFIKLIKEYYLWIVRSIIGNFVRSFFI